MDQPPTVAFTAFTDAWPRATETEIGGALCAIGAGRTLTFLIEVHRMKCIVNCCSTKGLFWGPVR